MKVGSVFENNRTQSVRLPAGTRFEKGVKSVSVRKVGAARIIEPLDLIWDSFFRTPEHLPSDDFMNERPEQHQQEREAL